ncbi:hypothetical protein [Actinocrispum sp. NPDC049592]|uniref:hypothetical protein n=1 Tax=Actinocrispum sp. NPDC049592 TaxID=3154835 RepID=UPI00341B2A8C
MIQHRPDGGEGMPGLHTSVTNITTGETVARPVTDGAGRFQLPDLRFGTYQVTSGLSPAAAGSSG